MKAVNRKTQFETWRLEVECKGSSKKDNPCGQYWELNGDDIVKGVETIMHECDIDIYGFVCPTCGSFTKIDTSLIPEAVRRKIDYKGEPSKKKDTPRVLFIDTYDSVFGRH